MKLLDLYNLFDLGGIRLSIHIMIEDYMYIYIKGDLDVLDRDIFINYGYTCWDVTGKIIWGGLHIHILSSYHCASFEAGISYVQKIFVQ